MQPAPVCMELAEARVHVVEAGDAVEVVGAGEEGEVGAAMVDAVDIKAPEWRSRRSQKGSDTSSIHF